MQNTSCLYPIAGANRQHQESNRLLVQGVYKDRECLWRNLSRFLEIVISVVLMRRYLEESSFNIRNDHNLLRCKLHLTDAWGKPAKW